MLDGKQISKKLIGSEDERAVSPVIGVILMVAITVILAAVIAAFVLDLGGSVGQEAQAGVSIEVDDSADEVTVQVTSLGNSDHVALGGDIADADDPESDSDVEAIHTDISVTEDTDADLENYVGNLQLETGDSVTFNETNGLDSSSGTITAVAVIEEDDTSTQVGSESFDF